jgi:hypothetical protein
VHIAVEGHQSVDGLEAEAFKPHWFLSDILDVYFKINLVVLG